MRHLNLLLIHYYFRFWKTNVRHIGILLSIWPIFRHQHVILHHPTKFHLNQTNCGGVMTSYRFFKMAASAMLISCEAVLHHPRSVTDGPSLIFKFRLDQIYIFGAVTSSILRPVRRHFWPCFPSCAWLTSSRSPRPLIAWTFRGYTDSASTFSLLRRHIFNRWQTVLQQFGLDSTVMHSERQTDDSS